MAHGIGPYWFHHHGLKMRVKVVIQGEKMIIEGSAATVVVTRCLDRWYLSWRIQHSADTIVEREVDVTSDDLKFAFGLADFVPLKDEYARILVDFPVDVQARGKYIRVAEYLTIPDPGTGNDGDTNVSIYVDDQIRTAARILLS